MRITITAEDERKILDRYADLVGELARAERENDQSLAGAARAELYQLCNNCPGLFDFFPDDCVPEREIHVRPIPRLRAAS